MSATAGWNADQIVLKIRNVTGTPSGDQLTDDQILTYANNYMVYTMPFELKEQIQLDFYDFKVFPGINVYPFSGNFLTDQPGAYADGFPLIFYQDPDIFYQDFPQQYAVDVVANGNGVTTNFTGALQNPPIIVGTVFFTDGSQVLQVETNEPFTETIATGSGATNYSGTLSLFPIDAGTLTITDGTETFADNSFGTLTGSKGGTGTINYSTGAWNVTFNSAVSAGISIEASYFSLNQTIGVLGGNGSGTINYITGAFNITFATAPISAVQIYAKYQGYQPNRPQGVLFFQNQFTFMPVPDQVYQIRMQGYIMPSLLDITKSSPPQAPTSPVLVEWGQLIAYGASLDIFADRGDLDNYNRYYPLLKRFENVALARTIQQYQAEQSVERF